MTAADKKLNTKRDGLREMLVVLTQAIEIQEAKAKLANVSAMALRRQHAAVMNDYLALDGTFGGKP